MKNAKKISLRDIKELKDDEYLLKIYDRSSSAASYILGFMTKLNKDGTVPKAFERWQPNYRDTVKDTFIMTETFKPGWKVHSYRTGKSQDWVKLVHPDGFIIEVYMEDFFEILADTSIIDSEIMGSFKWEDRTLIKDTNFESKELEKVTVWYSIENGGDGSAYPRWYLDSDEAEQHQEDMDEGWGEPCIGNVETYVGSDVHKAGVLNRHTLKVNDMVSRYYDDFWCNITGGSVIIHAHDKEPLSQEDTEFLLQDFENYDESLEVTFNK